VELRKLRADCKAAAADNILRRSIYPAQPLGLDWINFAVPAALSFTSFEGEVQTPDHLRLGVTGWEFLVPGHNGVLRSRKAGGRIQRWSGLKPPKSGSDAI